jgi:hypothetical protein
MIDLSTLIISVAVLLLLLFLLFSSDVKVTVKVNQTVRKPTGNKVSIGMTMKSQLIRLIAVDLFKDDSGTCEELALEPMITC